MSDILPGFLPKDVTKRIICLGKSRPTADAPKDTKVTFHFLTCLTKDPAKVLDDSRKMKKPMELVFGKQFKLEIWESMLKTMSLSEIAEFQVPKKYVSGYPFLSKTLRDAESVTVNTHTCCGVLAHGCGYHDLDHLFAEPEDLTFTFEIVGVEKPGEYSQDSWMLSLQEQLDSIPILKESGNRKFKSGNVSDAKADYFLALQRIEQLALAEKPGSPEFETFQEMKVPLLLNFGFCLMKEGVYYEAIQHLTTVVELNSSNAKAYFRRAKCYQTLGDFDKALQDYSKATELDQTLRISVIQEVKEITEARRTKDKTDRQIYNKLFV